MRIVAALCWYREPPEFLDRCVRSLEGVIDHVFALDGAWENFPEPARHSSAAEACAIADAAAAAGLGSTIWCPAAVYESQAAKRAELMRLASLFGDWILVIDADEHVAYADADAVRGRLSHSETVVGEITLTNRHQGTTLPGGLTRRLYRAGTTVETVHTGYTFQGRQLLRGEPYVDLTDVLHLEHDYANRGAERNQQAAEYLEARAANREEVWV